MTDIQRIAGSLVRTAGRGPHSNHHRLNGPEGSSDMSRRQHFNRIRSIKTGNNGSHILKDLDVARLLADPIKFKDFLLPPSGNEHLNYLAGLMQQNIIERNDAFRGERIAVEVSALINILSEEEQIKFAEIIKALEPDKEMIKGIIISGGEGRVVVETSATMVINAIASLLGINYSQKNQRPVFNTFSATSAGAFLAAGMAFRALNSGMFKVATIKNYEEFRNNPEELRRYLNEIMREAYKFSTGKNTEFITGKELKEMGSNLQLLVGELRKYDFPQIYLLPDELEKRFGIKPEELKLCDIALATSNSHIVTPIKDFFRLKIKSFLKDGKNQERLLFDPGISEQYLLPLHLLKKEIDNYYEGKIQKPGFYFVVGIKDSGLKPTSANLGYRIFTKVCDIYSKATGQETSDNLRRIGALRTFVEADCEVTIDQNGIKRDLQLRPLELNKPQEERELLIAANIPLVVEQLHKNLVHPAKSAYELYLGDIHHAYGMQHMFKEERKDYTSKDPDNGSPLNGKMLPGGNGKYTFLTERLNNVFQTTSQRPSERAAEPAQDIIEQAKN